MVNDTCYCLYHLKKQRLYQKNYRKKKREAGICIWPGCKVHTGTKAYCLTHLNEIKRLQPENHSPPLTEDEYTKLLDKQNNACAICKCSGKLIIDHDHSTLAVRGLLCGSCNTGLGCFKDNSKYLLAAIEYLRKNN